MKNQSPKQAAGWTQTQIYTAIVVVLIIGGIGGYLIAHNSQPAPESTTSTPTTGATLPPSILANPSAMADTQAKPLLAKLDANPKDVSTLTELGNIYFDASQWTTAIGYYTRSLNEAPKNPDVRTDMGIAYFYSGNADRALKEFDQALKDDPRHVQTLFNVGVVKKDGKHDLKGAIEAWESVLRIDPQYRDRAKLESMLAEAKAQAK
jgi:cytochrome c-type biogenesis protein CcmH/NrfG